MSRHRQTQSKAKIIYVHSPSLSNKQQINEGIICHDSNAHSYVSHQLQSSSQCWNNVQNYSSASSARASSASLSQLSPSPNVNSSIDTSYANQEQKCIKQQRANSIEACGENDLIELNRLKRQNRVLRLQLLRIQQQRQRQHVHINTKQQDNSKLNDLQSCPVTQSSTPFINDNKTVHSNAQQTNSNRPQGNAEVTKQEYQQNTQFIEVPALSMNNPSTILSHENNRLGCDIVSNFSSVTSSNSLLLHSHSSSDIQKFYNLEKTNVTQQQLHVQYNNDNNMPAISTIETTEQQKSKDFSIYQNEYQQQLQFQQKLIQDKKNSLCASNETIFDARSEETILHQNQRYDYDFQKNKCNVDNNSNSYDMDVCEQNEALKLRLQMLQRKSNREKLKRAATQRQLRYEIELLRLALDRETNNLQRAQQQQQQQRQQQRLSLQNKKSHQDDLHRVNSAHITNFAFHSTPICQSKTSNLSLCAQTDKKFKQYAPVQIVQPGRRLQLQLATNEVKKMNNNFIDAVMLVDSSSRKNKLPNTIQVNTLITTKNDISHKSDVKHTLGNAQDDRFACPLNINQLSLQSSELPAAYALHTNSSNRRAQRKARLLQVQRQMSQYMQQQLLSSSPTQSQIFTPITTIVTTSKYSDNKNQNLDNSNNCVVYSSVAFRRQRQQQQQQLLRSYNNYNNTTTSNNKNDILINPNQIGVEVTDKIKNRSWYLCKVIAYALRHSIQVCKHSNVCSTSTSSSLPSGHAQHNNEALTSISSGEVEAVSDNTTQTSTVDEIPCVMNKISTIALQRAINETVSYQFRCIHNLPHILLTPRTSTAYYDQTDHKNNSSSTTNMRSGVIDNNNTNSNNNNNTIHTNNSSSSCTCKVGFNEFCGKCQFQTHDVALQERIDNPPTPIHSLMSLATSYPHFGSSGSSKQVLHPTHECTGKQGNSVAFEEENDDANLISAFASSATNNYNDANDENLTYNAHKGNRSNNVQQTTSAFASSSSTIFSSSIPVTETGYNLHSRTMSTYSCSCNSSPANRSPRSPFHKSHLRGNYFYSKSDTREDVVSTTFHAPVIFAQIRDYLHCDLNQLRSAAVFSTWRQSLSPGKSGATLYYFGNYMVKSLRESEFTFFIRKLLPAYAMYCERNPYTFLCHFYALWTVQWVKLGDKRRYVLMHNIFNTRYYIHRIYDVKGSTIGRSGYSASQSQNNQPPSSSSSQLTISSNTKDVKGKKSSKQNCNLPPSRTAFGALLLKDNDLPSTLITCGAYQRAFLLAQFRSDVHFLLGLDIVDYSCVIGVRSRIFSGNEAHKHLHASTTSSSSSQEQLVKQKDNSAHSLKKSNLQTYLRHNHAKATPTVDNETLVSLCPIQAGADNLKTQQSSFVNIDNHSNYNNNECGYVYLHNCDGGLLSLPIYTTLDHSAAREDVYYIGLIDLLQQYNSAKKIESFAKGLINDRKAISVIPPKEYAQRLIKVLERITV